MTHEYTILTGGTVLPGGGTPPCTAIAWAGDTVLALGDDATVRAISRGDSRFADLAGAFVVPLPAATHRGTGGSATLEIGGPADLAVLDADPRLARSAPGSAGASASGSGQPNAIALVRRGRVVQGELPSPAPTAARRAPTERRPGA